eukprot:9923613-Ditylum_brightwellii.AAC.1
MVRTVRGGDGHTCAMLTSGNVYCWGLNDSGQLGTGSTVYLTKPTTPITPDSSGKIIDNVYVGWKHNCITYKDGSLACFGSGGSGELGLGDTSNRNVPTVLTHSVLNEAQVKAVGLGLSHTCALLDTNEVYCWGGQWGGDQAGANLGIGVTGNTNVPTEPVPLTNTFIPIATIDTGRNHNCV